MKNTLKGVEHQGMQKYPKKAFKTSKNFKNPEKPRIFVKFKILDHDFETNF